MKSKLLVILLYLPPILAGSAVYAARAEPVLQKPALRVDPSPVAEGKVPFELC
jgi:hypothetical protein